MTTTDIRNERSMASDFYVWQAVLSTVIDAGLPIAR